MNFAISRWRGFLIVLVLWAGIYLPGLGKQEFLGQEGRRVMPAITMLDTGNWIVPSMGGEEYYLKPPGINWIIASSFKIFGRQNEFTARFPSAIFILIFVSLLIILPYPWISLEGRLIAAIAFLTSIGIIDQGRLIEIEAIYISLTGIGVILWLYIWSAKPENWLLWIIYSLVLALGLLVKGPFILFFIYSAVISVLYYSSRLKDMFKIKHLVSIAITLLIAGGWFLLASHEITGTRTTMVSTMFSEFTMRIFIKPDFSKWGINVLKSFVLFLPWLLFVPMLWDKKLTSRIDKTYESIFKGCRFGLIVGFTSMILMPGMFARYVLPVYPLGSILLGWLLSIDKGSVESRRLWKNILLICFFISCLAAIAGLIYITKKNTAIFVLAITIFITAVFFGKRKSVPNSLSLSLLTAVLAVVVMLQYSVFGLEIKVQSDFRRPAALQINKIVPEGQIIYYLWHDYFYQAVFYLRKPVKYLHRIDEIDQQVHYLIMRTDDFDSLKDDKRFSVRSPEILYEFRIPTKYMLVKFDK